MEIQRINFEKYGEEIKINSDHYVDNYPSLDGKYNLHLDYAGEYPHGDSWHYGRLEEADSGKVIWEYKKGDPIRGRIKYPWSADSKSCYFTIINNGDRILQYDIVTGKLKTIFGSKVQNRLKGISFVPRNFNGLVFYDNAYDDVEQVDVYCFLSETQMYLKINDEILDDRFLISECGIKDSVVLICHSYIKIYDTLQRRVVEEFPVDNIDLKDYKRGHAHYLHKTDNIYFCLLKENEWRYYKLYYRQQKA